MAPQFQSCLRRCFCLRWPGHSAHHRKRDLLKYVQENASKGNAEAVIKSIDEYTTHTRLKRKLGKEKSYILDDAVKRCKPFVALELGAYCGYSTIRIADQMEKNSVLYSIEMNSYTYKIASDMIEHAGLSSKVRLYKGTLNELKEEIFEEEKYFDFIFMNHSKDDFLRDFLILKQEGVLHKGTWIVAQYIGFCRAKNYMNYFKYHSDEFEKEDLKNGGQLPRTLTVRIYKLGEAKDIPITS